MHVDPISALSLTRALHWISNHLLWPICFNLKHAYVQNPSHVILETICIITIIYLLLHRRFNPNLQQQNKLSEQEQEMLIEEWSPHPLAPTTHKQVPQLVVLGARTNGFVKVVGSDVPKLDFTSYDFLDFSSSESVKAECTKTILKFGVGSCGPRGFYGTVTPHLLLEDEFAKFIGAEAAILYSDGLATVSSVIASFSKAGDLIVCDDGVCHDIRCGLILSRSRVVFFKHNDVADLERTLRKIELDDVKLTKRAKHRTFIVVEGVYQNYGDICPINEVVRLKKQYCYRLILDDSLGFGVLGRTGRGTCETNQVAVSDVDIWCCRLDACLASVGGICCGSKQVAEHQRLSGAGYVFSASSAMFTCTAAVKALALIDEKPERCAAVRQLAEFARSSAIDIFGDEIDLGGSRQSPLLYIRFKCANSPNFYESIADYMFHYFHTITGLAKFVPNDQNNLPDGIRVAVSLCHTKEHLTSFMLSLRQAYLSEVFKLKGPV